ncbi:MAG: hypothetical protein ABFS28_13900 [Bacteroidota bacterium]
MNTQIALLALLLASASLSGQDKPYESTMLRTIESLHKATEKEDYLSCASQFERVANAEKIRWLPYYYSAYSLIILSFEESNGAEKDLILDRAQEMLDRALELEPDESELHALQAFLYPSRILVDPMNRGMAYMEKIFVSLERAKSLNPENPRPWFLEGMNKLNLPPAMGGGAEVARPILEKADARFRAFTNEDPLWPDWGAEANQAELKKLL